jgi:hypothetical protein
MQVDGDMVLTLDMANAIGLIWSFHGQRLRHETEVYIRQSYMLLV